MNGPGSFENHPVLESNR